MTDVTSQASANDSVDKPLPKTRIREVAEDKYRREWKALLEATDEHGKLKYHPETITANLLQSVAGGRYSKVADMLDLLREEWREAQKQKEQIPLQPAWFRDVVATGLSEADAVLRALPEGLWQQIGPHIESRILEATTRLETERDQMKEKYQEDRAHIELLENQIDELEQQLVKTDLMVQQLNDMHREAQSLAERRERELERSNDLLKDLENSQLKAERALEEARRERDTLSGQYSRLQKDFQEAKQTHRSTEEKRSEQLKIAEETATVAKKDSEQQKVTIDELKTQLAKVQDDERDAILKRQHLVTTVDNLQGQLKETGILNNNLGNENRVLLQKISKLETLLDEAGKTIRKAEKREREQQAQLKAKKQPRKPAKDKDSGSPENAEQ